MATEFKIPNLGDSVDSGEVISLLVKEGDTIAKDDPVMELETGKATIEVPSEVSGKIIKVHVKEGDSVAPDQVALTVEAADDAASPEDDAGDEPAEESAEKPARADAEQAESSAADSPSAAASEEESGSTKEEAPAEKPAPVAPPKPESSRGDRVPVAAAPSVRKFAREIGVNIQEVKGEGANGRIRIEDVKAYAKQRLTQPVSGSAAGGGWAAPALPDFTQWGEVERERMSGIRKATARHMALCWGTIPHVTQQDKADITDVEQLRKQYGPQAEQAGGKLTLTAVLLKIVALALKRHPAFNASLDLANEELVLKKYVNVGVAVDTPKGLLVPVVRDADRKSIVALAVELTEISGKAREGKIGPTDMQGGTFTISNLGGIGGSYFTPIVNHPEVAILGVGRGAYEPVYKDGQFEPRLMLPLSLSYDHRVIDGADGARFIRWIAGALQNPLLTLM